jgi:hypothetical protein
MVISGRKWRGGIAGLLKAGRRGSSKTRVLMGGWEDEKGRDGGREAAEEGVIRRWDDLDEEGRWVGADEG